VRSWRRRSWLTGPGLRLFGLRTLLAQDAIADEFNHDVQVPQSHLLESFVRLADELVDAVLVAHDVGFEVVEIEDLGPLGLREHEVQEKDEAEPGVEGDPADDEEGP